MVEAESPTLIPLTAGGESQPVFRVLFLGAPSVGKSAVIDALVNGRGGPAAPRLPVQHVANSSRSTGAVQTKKMKLTG